MTNRKAEYYKTLRMLGQRLKEPPSDGYLLTMTKELIDVDEGNFLNAVQHFAKKNKEFPSIDEFKRIIHVNKQYIENQQNKENGFQISDLNKIGQGSNQSFHKRLRACLNKHGKQFYIDNCISYRDELNLKDFLREITHLDDIDNKPFNFVEMAFLVEHG